LQQDDCLHMLDTMSPSTPHPTQPRGWLELETIRTRDGWDIGDLAAAAGLSREALRLYENGQRNPRPSTIRKLADALRVPYSVLAPSPREGDRTPQASGDAA
jgi:transcriptional regulator with XRE-family HTH domain